MYYVELSVNLNFSLLYQLSTLVQLFSYFARLQMEDMQVLDDTGNLLDLHTFCRPDDWAKITDQGVIDFVLKNPCAIRNPFNLIPPSITDIHADTQVGITHKNWCP